MLYELKLLISLTEPEVKSVERAHFLIKWAKASEPIDPLRLCYAMLCYYGKFCLVGKLWIYKQYLHVQT